MERLLALRGRDVEVVLRNQEGKTWIQYARVRQRGVTAERIYFDRHYKSRPNVERPLLAEFWERRLHRAFPTTVDDQKLLRESKIELRSLDLSDAVVEGGLRRFQVLSVKPIELTGPAINSVLVYKAVKLNKEVDPWQSTEGGEPSAWVIRYGPPESPDRFEFRLHNPPHHPIPAIDTVEVHDEPQWFFDDRSGVHQPCVCFTVRYIGRGPVVGYFMLDSKGLPCRGDYQMHLVVDDKTRAELAKLAVPRRRQMRHSADVSRHGADVAGNGSSKGHLLRYNFRSGERFRMVTQRTTRSRGKVLGVPVELTRTYQEHATVEIQSVDADGTAQIVITPWRYVATVTAETAGEETSRESVDTEKPSRPDAPILRHFADRCRAHLKQKAIYSVNSQGAMQRMFDDRDGDDYAIFTKIVCGFTMPLFPPLPDDRAVSGNQWREVDDLGGCVVTENEWSLTGEGDSKELVLAAQGTAKESLSRGDTQGRACPFEGVVWLAYRSMLPVEQTRTFSRLRVSDKGDLGEVEEEAEERRWWLSLEASEELSR